MKLPGTRSAFPLTLLICLLLNADAGAQANSLFPGTTAVGQASVALTVTVTITASGTAATEHALTQGLANAEFFVMPGGDCAVGVAYTAGQHCTASVQFSPKYPGLRSGAVVLTNAAGAVLGMALLGARATGSLPVFTPGRIDTVAGNSFWVYQGDGGPALATPIFLPNAVATNAAGDLYISDSLNNRIRRVDALSGDIFTIAGTGTPGYNGDGAAATRTMVSTPAGFALDGAGNLYFADTGNHIVRRLDAFTGIVTTVAGTPTVQGFTGDNSPATSATLSFPEGVAFDAAGNLLIADTGNNVVREVDVDSGTIHTIAGTGVAGYNGDNRRATTAQLHSPWSVQAAADGSILVADLNNNRVRRISVDGMITSIVGTGARVYAGDGGQATSAGISEPTSLVLDPAGNLYIADAGNNRVRVVAANTGVITTFAGTGGEEFGGDSGPANQAAMYGPSALYFDAAGNLFLTDMFHNRVRRISALTTALLYPVMKVGKKSAPQTVLLANDGNAPLVLKTPLFANAADDTASTTCTAGATIRSAETCVIGSVFAPTSVGNPVNGTNTVESDSGYTAPVISLSGEVLSIAPTETSLVSSLNPSLVGAVVTFTATVADGEAPLSGNIVFFDGTTQLCSTPIAGTAATCNASALTLGQHDITAAYAGDINNAGSTSDILVQTVKQGPVLTLVVSPNPATATGSVQLTLTATAPAGTPSGTVTFLDGIVALQAVTLSGSGGAVYATTQLSAGTHSLSARYAGDTVNMAGTSNVVSEVIQQAVTSTSLSSSASTAPVGMTVTLTATITSSNGPAPTGTVTFREGTAVLGTSTVVSGTAALALSSLAPGSHSIVAAYSGDSDDAASTSAPLVQIIQQIATDTMLAPDVNPVAAGAVLHLAATVTAAGGTTNGGALTGNVSFREGTTILGSVAVDGTGHATLPISTLSAGTHNIYAVYRGSVNYATSTSSTIAEVVQSTSSLIALSSPLATTLAGQTASFTATVSSSTGIPTGNVVFNDGGSSIGQAQLNAQGIAVFTTTSLTVGTHAITANYGGDGSYTAAASVALPHTVVLATTGLTLAAPSGVIDAGKAFSMMASLTSNGVAPTGTLSLRDGSATIATQTVAAGGTFTFPGVTLSVGSHALTAVYAGDADNANAVSAVVNVVVQIAPTSTTIVSSLNPATSGQSVLFTATVASVSPNAGGVMTFMDGSTVIGSSPVLANLTASLSTNSLGLGTHGITASYGGDANHAGSNSVALSQQVMQADAATLTSSANPSNAGANVVFTMRVAGPTSPAPSGAVVFRDGAATLGTSTLDGSGSATMQTADLTVGTHTMTASYAGDANYAAATATLVQTVQSASTQVTLAASSNPAIYATPLTLTASVVGNGGVAAGTVQFLDGSVSLGTATLNASGVATLTTSALLPGDHAITASYVGNASTQASVSAPQTVTVKELTSVALASNANPAMTLSALVLTATVSNSGVGKPSGSVTFSDGATQLGIASLDANGRATLSVASMTAGNHALQASYAGDGDNFSGVSSAITQGVVLRPTTITVSGTSTNPLDPQQVTLIAVVRWTGPVQATGTVAFSSGASVLGSSAVDASGIATLNVELSSTAENIIATYSGDVSYADSVSLAASISGGAASQFTMLLSPPSATFASGEHTTVKLSLVSVSQFADTLQLGCLGLPYAATCTFSSPQVSMKSGEATSVELTVDTGNPLGAGATASNRPARSGVLLCFLPCLLGIALVAKRRRVQVGTLLLLMCAGGLTISATGCSGLHMHGTPAGTYQFKVTAAGVNTGATMSQTMTLTVTP